MLSFLTRNFFLFDFAIGAAVPLTVAALRARGLLSLRTWRLFWVGVLIGLTWEVPLSTLDGLSIVDVFHFITPAPAHFSVIIVSHTFWDGGLFLVGVWLVQKVCAAPHFAAFRWSELGVLMLWGQLQELAVELTATGSGGWTYVPAWWNPSLFSLRGHHITVMPQLIWLAAPVVFYFAALALGGQPHRSRQEGA